ncbi:chlorophyll synthase ChlG [Bradyrhizobium sp.]|uniref:chlorophyll synthase ChlG n=1 Tax=Bradyrhizobium sp. TaxID=376 RepID=UPI0039E5F180
MTDIAPTSPLRHPSPLVVLELLKPITWFPPMWAFCCGIVSSGQSPAGRWPLVLTGLLLVGPLVCATSQAANDWFDRHVDAINEPNRPIPSGRIPGRWGFYIALVWTALSLAVAAQLGPWACGATIFGLILAWAYSAPPIRLKQNGWIGNSAVGLCYEGLPWLTAAAIMTNGTPDWRIAVVALLYSLGAHGIMTLNDFKSIEGDRRMGILSLPVHLGAHRSALLACVTMALAQATVVALLWVWARPYHAAIVAAMLIGQFALMRRLLQDPRERAPWYNATGVSLYVLGMLVTAFALGGLHV